MTKRSVCGTCLPTPDRVTAAAMGRSMRHADRQQPANQYGPAEKRNGEILQREAPPRDCPVRVAQLKTHR